MIAKIAAFTLMWMTLYLAASQPVLADPPCTGDSAMMQGDASSEAACCDSDCDEPCELNCATSGASLISSPHQSEPFAGACPAHAVTVGIPLRQSDPPRHPPRVI